MHQSSAPEPLPLPHIYTYGRAVAQVIACPFWDVTVLTMSGYTSLELTLPVALKSPLPAAQLVMASGRICADSHDGSGGCTEVAVHKDYTGDSPLLNGGSCHPYMPAPRNLAITGAERNHGISLETLGDSEEYLPAHVVGADIRDESACILPEEGSIKA